MKEPDLWAGVSLVLLVISAPILLAWGLLGLLSPPEGVPEAPEGPFLGGLIAALGALVTGTVWLIARRRAEPKRRRWLVAALVVGAVMVLIGPVWAVGAYLWMVRGV